MKVISHVVDSSGKIFVQYFKSYFFHHPSDLMEGYKAIELSEDQMKGERSLWTQCRAVADMKFTYVVSCQQYGIHKRSGDPRALDILRLMTVYGSIIYHCTN